MALLQVLVVSVLAGLLALLGRYGWRNAAQLVPGYLDAEGKVRKERSLRRGSLMCFVIALTMVAAALASALTARPA